MESYEVVRFYRKGHPQEVVATGLTREEAQEMCADDEGSSATCCGVEATRLAHEKGDWFLGFRREN